VHPFDLGGAYPNFMMDDEGDARLQATYGDNYSRLATVKSKYDPAKSVPGEPEHQLGRLMTGGFSVETATVGVANDHARLSTACRARSMSIPGRRIRQRPRVAGQLASTTCLNQGVGQFDASQHHQAIGPAAFMPGGARRHH
jgi:hypothetical protein